MDREELQIVKMKIISSSEFPGHSSTNSSLDDANNFRRWYLRLNSCWGFSGPKKIAYRSHGMRENITRNPCSWGVNPCFFNDWHKLTYVFLLSDIVLQTNIINHRRPEGAPLLPAFCIAMERNKRWNIEITNPEHWDYHSQVISFPAMDKNICDQSQQETEMSSVSKCPTLKPKPFVQRWVKRVVPSDQYHEH